MATEEEDNAALSCAVWAVLLAGHTVTGCLLPLGVLALILYFVAGGGG